MQVGAAQITFDGGQRYIQTAGSFWLGQAVQQLVNGLNGFAYPRNLFPGWCQRVRCGRGKRYWCG